MRRNLLFIAISIAGLTFVNDLQAGDWAQVIEIKPFGGTISSAFSINEAGDVTGFATTVGNAETHAYLYSRQLNQTVDINSLGSKDSRGASINNAQQIVGNYADSKGHVRSFIYSNGQMKDLPFQTDNLIAAINDSRRMAGQIFYNPGVGRLFSYQLDANNFQIIAPMLMLKPTSINSKGRIAGWGAMAKGGSWHPLILSPGIKDLLLGNDKFSAGQAFGINDHDDVTGSITLQDRSNHAFLYSNNTISDLGVPAKSSEAWGQAINNKGEIVGYSNGPRKIRAFSYDLISGFRDLNDMLPADSPWVLERALSVNDRGEIAGIGKINGQQHAFIFVPPVKAATTTNELSK